MSTRKRFVIPVSVLLLAGLLLTACGQPASPASCAFVAGNGTDGYDSNLHRIIYPGQIAPEPTHENITYVPCNSRNYIINDGKVKDANGNVVGDRHVLIFAATSTGVPIMIAARALWTLNQSEVAMRAFYNVCFKYQCASVQDQAGSANYSTPGWNGMLGENFSPAMDTAARIAAIKVADAIWKSHDPTQYQILADSMSAAFGDAVRANLGYPMDLFCGSGNSTWSDPTKPGEGEFTCTPVRIVVDDVQRGQVQADDSTEGVRTINAQRLTNAQALYGPEAGYWLGLQDSIDRCKNADTACVFNIGGVGSAAVAIPVNNSLPITTTASTANK